MAAASPPPLPNDTPLSHPDIEAQYLPFDGTDDHWQGITPIYQDDGPAEVMCGIMYDPAYSSAMDLFRALYPPREISPRALALTTHLACFNPSNYSVMAYRADVLSSPTSTELGDRSARLRRELQWMEKLAKGNLKSYQVWQYRRLILNAVEDISIELLQGEMKFIASVLESDSKNYHTWAYRQWVLAQYAGMAEDHEGSVIAGEEAIARGKFPQLWEGELPYTNLLLGQDARNNSAWNHRFFVIFGSRRGAVLRNDAVGISLDGVKDGSASPHHNGGTHLSQQEQNLRYCIEAEVNYTKRSLSLIPSNPSAWTYLRGVLSLLPASSFPAQLSSYDIPRWIRTDLLSSDLLDPTNPLPEEPQNGRPSNVCLFALEYLLDVFEEEQKQLDTTNTNTNTNTSSNSASPKGQEEVERIVEILQREDPVRRKWWEVRRREVLRSIR